MRFIYANQDMFNFDPFFMFKYALCAINLFIPERDCLTTCARLFVKGQDEERIPCPQLICGLSLATGCRRS